MSADWSSTSELRKPVGEPRRSNRGAWLALLVVTALAAIGCGVFGWCVHFLSSRMAPVGIVDGAELAGRPAIHRAARARAELDPDESVRWFYAPDFSVEAEGVLLTERRVIAWGPDAEDQSFREAATFAEVCWIELDTDSEPLVDHYVWIHCDEEETNDFGFWLAAEGTRDDEFLDDLERSCRSANPDFQGIFDAESVEDDPETDDGR